MYFHSLRRDLFAHGHFITRNSSNSDWYYTGDETTDNTRWQSAKTIYDPCPVGYRVPDGGPTGVWSTAFGTSDNFNEEAYDSTNEGFNFGKSDINRYLTEESDCWYPAVGYLRNINGSLVGVGDDCDCWSCSPNGEDAYDLNFHSNGLVSPSSYYYRAYGQSVRCLRE